MEAACLQIYTIVTIPTSYGLFHTIRYLEKQGSFLIKRQRYRTSET